jgi:uncharacterized protein YyaL (SSP411 family)
MPNRLARERSPYLLQHATNPVDWYPWGEDAFELARRTDRPIFLSIGYSTCHWCHVMEHESFEDVSIAELLNRGFVSIKVDREERPDIDRVYMTFVQATTGAGGWPMSVWLTPDLKPFFGGTYFPPTSRWGRPGFAEVLDQLGKAWRNDRPQVLQSAESVLERLREATSADGRGIDRAPGAGRGALDAGIAAFAQAFDSRRGGFGGAPKFPRPSELLFLMRASALTGDARGRQMAIDTIRAMAFGGMRDQIGGGFHRYSVDADWRVPHFEKMLYDQAQIALACLEAAQASGDPFYAAIAEDTLDYVVRDLTSPEGAFYSAEDADSLVPPSAEDTAVAVQSAEVATVPAGTHTDHPPGEKREGAFYVWTAAEIDRLLGDDAALVRRRFGIEEGGNAVSDPQGEFRGQNILHVAQSIEDVAARLGRPIEDVMRALARARQRLYDTRNHRPRPHLDDKIITAWNGLMIAAFARAARVLVSSRRRAEWLRAAERAADVLEAHLWSAVDRQLLRRLREGEAAIDGFCEDYACLTWGVLELFQATGARRWLDWAIELTEGQIARFYDEHDGGWFSTTGADASVLLRMKEDYDGAEPAAASVTVHNLLVLGHLVNDRGYVERAQRALERYGPGIDRVVRVMPLMVANLVLWHQPAAQCVIVGEAGSEERVALEQAVANHYVPWLVQVPVAPGEAQAALGERLPWLSAMHASDGRAAAYVCRDFTCQAPVEAAETLDAQIADIAAPRRIV